MKKVWRTRSRRPLVLVLVAIAALVAPALPADANHIIMTHRDGYDFLYANDNLNSRGNRTVYSNEVSRRGYTTGHLAHNAAAQTAFTNLASRPLMYYTSGHNFYFEGGPTQTGGFAAENYWNGQFNSAMANNAAQTGIANAFVDTFDITAAPLNGMVLAVIQRCMSGRLDSTQTSNAHAFHRNNTGAAMSLGFRNEVFFDVSATNTSLGPDAVWAAEFWRQIGSGQRVGTAATAANNRVVAANGAGMGYDSWFLVGNNGFI